MYNVCHLSSIYCHPVEYIFGNALPSLISVFIFKSNAHVISYGGWIMFRFIETHEGHSGIHLPVSPFSVFPFSAGATYHNYHHLKNEGNFASFMTIWDRIFGTNQSFIEDQKLKKKIIHTINL